MNGNVSYISSRFEIATFWANEHILEVQFDFLVDSRHLFLVGGRLKKNKNEQHF